MEIEQQLSFENLIKSGSSLKDLLTEINESILVYGSTGSGKTYFYMSIPQYYKSIGLKPENFAMAVIYPDRPGGYKKVGKKHVPPEFRERIIIRPIHGDFLEVIDETNKLMKVLTEFARRDKNNVVWLVVEMLDEMWDMAQDTAIREAYGIGLGEFMAEKRKQIVEKAQLEGSKEPSAYQALSGAFGGEWVTIKNLHNTEWIEKLKSAPVAGVNLLFTAGEKDASSTPFTLVGKEPRGEKSNHHRVDTILYLKQSENKFTMQPVKITGFSYLYEETDVTNKIPFNEHIKQLKALEEHEKKQKSVMSQIQEKSEGKEEVKEENKEEIEWI